MLLAGRKRHAKPTLCGSQTFNVKTTLTNIMMSASCRLPTSGGGIIIAKYDELRSLGPAAEDAPVLGVGATRPSPAAAAAVSGLHLQLRVRLVFRMTGNRARQHDARPLGHHFCIPHAQPTSCSVQMGTPRY